LTKPIRIFLCDDLDSFRAWLHEIFAPHDDLELVGDAPLGDHLVEHIRACDPDAVMVKVRFSTKPSDLQVAQTIKAALSDMTVVIWSHNLDFVLERAEQDELRQLGVEIMRSPDDVAKLPVALSTRFSRSSHHSPQTS